MRRRFVHAVAWTLATLAAVTVSWFGVRVVLDSTSDRPHTVPLSGRAPSDPADGPSRSPESREPPSAVGTATERPSPTPPADPTPPSSPDEDAGDDGDAADAGDSTQQDRPAESTAGDVRTYPVAGGRVTFEMDADSAELVSATPEAGWQMQTWEQTAWIRVDFVAGDRRTSVICMWHDGPPRVETNEHAT